MSVPILPIGKKAYSVTGNTLLYANVNHVDILWPSFATPKDKSQQKVTHMFTCNCIFKLFIKEHYLQ